LADDWQIVQVSLGHSLTQLPFQIIFEEYLLPSLYGKKMFKLLFFMSLKLIKLKKILFIDSQS
jgi:hypothetical protein